DAVNANRGDQVLELAHRLPGIQMGVGQQPPDGDEGYLFCAFRRNHWAHGARSLPSWALVASSSALMASTWALVAASAAKTALRSTVAGAPLLSASTSSLSAASACATVTGCARR